MKNTQNYIKSHKIINNHKDQSNYLRKSIITIFIITASLPIVMLITSLICYLLKDPISYINIASISTYIIWGAISGFVIRLRHKDSSYLSRILPIIYSVIIYTVIALIYSLKITKGYLMNITCFALVASLTIALNMLFIKNKSLRKYR